MSELSIRRNWPTWLMVLGTLIVTPPTRAQNLCDAYGGSFIQPVCCAASCGEKCGEVGCKADPSTRALCCPKAILDSGLVCTATATVAPCILPAVPDLLIEVTAESVKEGTFIVVPNPYRRSRYEIDADGTVTIENDAKPQVTSILIAAGPETRPFTWSSATLSKTSELVDPPPLDRDLPINGAIPDNGFESSFELLTTGDLSAPIILTNVYGDDKNVVTHFELEIVDTASQRHLFYPSHDKPGWKIDPKIYNKRPGGGASETPAPAAPPPRPTATDECDPEKPPILAGTYRHKAEDSSTFILRLESYSNTALSGTLTILDASKNTEQTVGLQGHFQIWDCHHRRYLLSLLGGACAVPSDEPTPFHFEQLALVGFGTETDLQSGEISTLTLIQASVKDVGEGDIFLGAWTDHMTFEREVD